MSDLVPVPEGERPGENDVKGDNHKLTVPRARNAEAERVALVALGIEPKFDKPEYAGEVGTFNQYRVLKKLGEGGMGAVYLAYNTSLERFDALKVMLPANAADPKARDRFLREARAAAKVRSDHVVTIYEVNEAGDIPYIAMEYLLGHSLDKFLSGGRELSLAQTLRVVRETALGLVEVHKRGLVHRDVKPDNIWLEAPKGRVKLLDFGLARPVIDDSKLTDRDRPVGTPAYMSPEQARNSPALDHHSDLFSLGVVLYRLVTGRMPFTGDTRLAIGASIIADAPVPVRKLKPDVPPALEDVVNRLLQKEPKKRFRTAREVVDAISEIERGLARGSQLVVTPIEIKQQEEMDVWKGIPASAFRTGLPMRTPPSLGLKPVLLAGGLLFAACAVLLAAVFQPWKTAQAPQPSREENPPKPVVRPAPVPPKVDLEPDRKAALYILSFGGSLRVNDVERSIKTVAELPKEPFRLTSANLHGLDRRRVRDEDLAAFSGCKHLTYLDLNDNPLVTDKGLVHFKDCAGLTSLGLNGTQVTNTRLADFGRCLELRQLALSGTPVTNEGLAHFKNCTKIVDINLNYTKVTDDGLAVFKDRDMTHLNLSGLSKLTDAGLAHFKGCKSLIHLDLVNTPVGDPGMEVVKDFKKLKELHLNGTKVTAGKVAELKQVLRDCTIAHGPIPIKK